MKYRKLLMVLKDIRKKDHWNQNSLLLGKEESLVMGYVISWDEEIISDGKRWICWINMPVLQLETIYILTLNEERVSISKQSDCWKISKTEKNLYIHTFREGTGQDCKGPSCRGHRAHQYQCWAISSIWKSPVNQGKGYFYASSHKKRNAWVVFLGAA